MVERGVVLGVDFSVREAAGVKLPVQNAGLGLDRDVRVLDISVVGVVDLLVRYLERLFDVIEVRGMSSAMR